MAVKKIIKLILQSNFKVCDNNDNTTLLQKDGCIEKPKHPSHLNACRQKHQQRVLKTAAGETLITEDRKKRIYVLGDSIVKHIK